MGEDKNLEPGQTEPDAHDGDDALAEPSVANAAPVQVKDMTPGQRLAAKKAHKAQKKKEFKDELKRKEEEAREKELEEASRVFASPPEPALPEDVQKVAGNFTDFVQRNRGRILGSVGAFIGIGALALLAQRFLFTGAAEQAGLLGAALETASAPVDADDADGKTDEGDPVFKARDERARKAAESLASVVKKDPSSLAAGWANVGAAALKLELGKPDEARALFESAFLANKHQPLLAARALEGTAIALEASGKVDDALKRYEELKSYDNGANKDLAEYHLARIKLQRGDREGAKALLKPLYDRLNDAPTGTPPRRYLKGEVEVRLAEIDSSLVDKPSSGAGGSQFSQEELQRLIEQLRSQQGGAGDTPE